MCHLLQNQTQSKTKTCQDKLFLGLNVTSCKKHHDKMCRLKGHDLIKLLFQLLILNHFQLCMVSSFYFEVENTFSENFKLGIQCRSRGERFRVLAAKPPISVLSSFLFPFEVIHNSYFQRVFIQWGKLVLKLSSMRFRIPAIHNIAIFLSRFSQMHIGTLLMQWHLRLRYSSINLTLNK